jgi:hypothetical protein
MLCEAVKSKLVVFGGGKLFFGCFCNFGGLGDAFGWCFPSVFKACKLAGDSPL